MRSDEGTQIRFEVLVKDVAKNHVPKHFSLAIDDGEPRMRMAPGQVA